MKHNKSLWQNQVVICITFDLDWANEVATKFTYDIIEKFGFSSTFFLTHPSKLLLEKINKKEIHGGIHPNFLKNSTQGKNYNEVIDYCTKLLPDADVFRSHKYFDNNEITEKLIEKGYKYDSNLCTNLEIVEPFAHRSGLIRFPVFFEDGGFLLHGNNLSIKEFQQNFLKTPGLYIFNFHPMNLILNPPSYSYIRKLKATVPQKTWNNFTDKEFEHLAFNGKGIRNFTLDLFNYIKKENFTVLNLEEVYEVYESITKPFILSKE